MRGSISESRLREIRSKLPALKEGFSRSAFPDPAVVRNDIDKGTDLELALICLGDAHDRCGYCNLALGEAFANLAWYRDDSPTAPQEFEAVYAAKFYADYVPLILYAGAEDVAAFIAHFLNVVEDVSLFLNDPEVQRELGDKRISSSAGKIATYMKHKYPVHKITRIITELHRNRHWRIAMDYRNTWVHEKPPIVDGLGIQLERKSQKMLKDGCWVIPIGARTVPKHDIDQLLETDLQATHAFAAVLNELIDIAEEQRPRVSR